MSKQTIKATINANIKQNGVQAITGQVMNSVLNQMVDGLAEEKIGGDEIIEVVEDGFFIVDSSLNIGYKFDATGLHGIGILEYEIVS